MALKRIMLGTIMVAGHLGAHDPFKGPQRVCVCVCVLIHIVHRYAGKRCQCISF